MPGWGGCDVCAVIDELRLVLGESLLPAAANFDDPKLSVLEARLKAEPDAPLSHCALIVADGLRAVGMTDMALQISEGISRVVTTTDSTSASLLGRAQVIRARTLDMLGRTAEANSAFAMAEHLYSLAGRTQRFKEE